MRPGAAAAAGIAAAIGLVAPARAAGADGVYGRFDGDLELRGQAGAAFASGGPALAVSASALFLSTAGIYAHYTEAFGSASPTVTRSLATGVHIAPVFLARYALNRETGPARLDLLVDSIGFEVGAFWHQPQRAEWHEKPGLELALGLLIPFLPRVSGPVVGLRAALRWRPQDFAVPAPALVERGALLAVTFGWRQAVRAHLVDAGDGVRP